ncbi:uncharacterized protein BCR38DRAFT_353751 [Pseudomassariella vexata]|uniref:Homeobox and C2H2 transcription factor n=1 Tax=Pseudomassariella vexata TaxID=1141098 RepID=A0A1Y2DFQ5_9PEZI|nr:uncharacterized protein BCR38DRAFT_353751 [Pseudomassariella vexata]ORY58101.1 hypothetical protein BCR38DRAFT_353751 [Pseudomassariella vexata]
MEEMDFVNWDAAGADAGLDLPSTSEGMVPVTTSGAVNMDLVLGDVDGDDWSFWALQHFDSTHTPEDLGFNPAAMDGPLAPMAESLTAQLYWETPEAPCSHCALGGYQCKLIREGSYNGYCTSCVALRCECSFVPVGNTAGSEVGARFPANPWPTMGDRPESSILHEDEFDAVVSRTLNPSEPPPGAETDTTNSAAPQNMPKIGARFSRESVRILKNWVSTHSRHPYPTEDDKEGLQKMTGLNKTQITNWLANARRRGKIQPTRSISPHVGSGYVSAIDITKRRPTTPLFENMNPLQRWANSPPENEPADVTDIVRAVTASSNVTSSSGRNSPYISGNSDDGSGKSLCNQSSASSFSISQSSGISFASSLQSRGSFGSLPSFAHSRGRRRRRRAPPNRVEQTGQLPQLIKTFQCTFCTETFRTKHDWQRHEKSLHLSLERWVCSPEGAKAINPENGLMSCVFCGEANPGESHIESHKFSDCTERALEERTFYRKDHLRQHLNLIHNVKFLQWSMDRWRVASPEIRSRCGFCDIVMDSWTMRVDHLAEHFKTGKTMADWKGDWGFDAPVLDMVENSVPPYLIHDVRNSPLPYVAGAPPPSTPNSAYELLKMELQYWIANWTEEKGQRPTGGEITQEACRIVFGAEVLSQNPSNRASSWLRDAIMSIDEIRSLAMFSPVRGQPENRRFSSLRINGKDNIFQNCELEAELQEFVKAGSLLGLTAMDKELQVEACKIIGWMEGRSSTPSEDVANWLLGLINGSTKWLADFRKRARLPRSEDVSGANERSKDPKSIDSTVHNYSRLERELGEFIQVQRVLSLEPTAHDLQRQARIIIYESDDPWNQTAADDSGWLASFRQGHAPQDGNVIISNTSGSPSNHTPSWFQFAGQRSANTRNSFDSISAAGAGSGCAAQYIKTGPFFLSDTNCYRRLARGLSRFVASTMSANNPNRHIPTDEEIQHQARWVVHDDDDPCNQTAADNVEWLQRFKRDVGILPPDSGPGLPTETIQWPASTGGTGFAPPYVAPNPKVTLEPFNAKPKVFCRENAKQFEPEPATVNRLLQSFQQRYMAPAKVFCSRELETGLTEYVKREMRKSSSSSGGGVSGGLPSDDQMRERAREIMGMQKTPCDDPVLLARFKEAFLQGNSELGLESTTTAGMGGIASSTPVRASKSADVGSGLDMSLPSGNSDQPMLFAMEDDLTFTDQEMGDVLQRANSGFGTDAGLLDLDLDISPEDQSVGTGSGSGFGF